MTTATLRAADVSKAVRRAYIRRVKNAQRAIGRLEDGAVRDLRRDLVSARNAIVNALSSSPTEFQQWHLPQVKRAVEEALSDYTREATAHLSQATDQAWRLGIERAPSAARAVGIDVNMAAFEFGVPRDALEFAQGWGADLIQAEADDIVKLVTKNVRLGVAGGMDREALIRSVSKAVTKPLRFGSFRSRAEAIVRTEVNRIHNAAHDAGREKLEAENVKVRKKWLADLGPRTRPNHRKMHGVVVDAGERFPYPGLSGKNRPRYPLDPILPASESVRCRCTTVDVFEVMDEDDVSAVQEALS